MQQTVDQLKEEYLRKLRHNCQKVNESLIREKLYNRATVVFDNPDEETKVRRIATILFCLQWDAARCVQWSCLPTELIRYLVDNTVTSVVSRDCFFRHNMFGKPCDDYLIIRSRKNRRRDLLDEENKTESQILFTLSTMKKILLHYEQ